MAARAAGHGAETVVRAAAAGHGVPAALGHQAAKMAGKQVERWTAAVLTDQREPMSPTAPRLWDRKRMSTPPGASHT
eukprot:456773-Heterocapsa_arctica.AAC.1